MKNKKNLQGQKPEDPLFVGTKSIFKLFFFMYNFDVQFGITSVELIIIYYYIYIGGISCEKWVSYVRVKGIILSH